MKTFYGSMVLLLLIATNVQGQFRNFGNFHPMTGSTITFYGDVMIGGTFTDDSQEITFNGPGGQQISGSGTITFKNLTADNAAGVTLQQHVVVTFLSLDSGPLNLNGRTITINNNAATAISRTNGYIVSENVSNTNKVVWNIGANTTPHVFPFGTASGSYIPLTITNTAGDIGNVTVSTYPTSSSNLPYPTTPTAVTNVNNGYGDDNSPNVVDRFWQIDKDGASGTATITFEATPAEVGSITNLQAQRWNSATQKWDAPIAGQVSGATSVTVTGVTTFSPWAVSGNNSPLPIELLSFTATPEQTGVSIDWKTASEHNNAYFTVLRSKDGKQFSDIATVPSAGDGKVVRKYNYFDGNAFLGRSYYQLKQTDLDGTFTLSEVRTVTLAEDAMAFTLFPNPTTNNEFSLDFQRSLDSPTAVTVYNVLGAIVYSTIVRPGVKTFLIHLSSPPKGVYIVRAVSDKFNFQHALVVK